MYIFYKCGIIDAAAVAAAAAAAVFYFLYTHCQRRLQAPRFTAL